MSINLHTDKLAGAERVNCLMFGQETQLSKITKNKQFES